MSRRKANPPKEKKQYSLRAELVRRIQLEAVRVGCFDSAVVEKALDLYFSAHARHRDKQSV